MGHVTQVSIRSKLKDKTTSPETVRYQCVSSVYFLLYSGLYFQPISPCVLVAFSILLSIFSIYCIFILSILLICLSSIWSINSQAWERGLQININKESQTPLSVREGTKPKQMAVLVNN